MWITEGVFPKLLFQQKSELEVVVASHLVPSDPAMFLRGLGLLQAVSGVLALVLRGWPLRLVLACQLVGLVVLPILVSIQEPTLWVHPFGPLTKNVPILVGTAVVLVRSRTVTDRLRAQSLFFH